MCGGAIMMYRGGVLVCGGVGVLCGVGVWGVMSCACPTLCAEDGDSGGLCRASPRVAAAAATVEEGRREERQHSA